MTHSAEDMFALYVSANHRYGETFFFKLQRCDSLCSIFNYVVPMLVLLALGRITTRLGLGEDHISPYLNILLT